MKVTYIATSINGTTGLERMILFQTDYFIETFNYQIDLILLNTKYHPNRSNFKINKNIKITHVKCKKDNSLSYLREIKSIKKIIKSIRPNVVMVSIDEVFGLFLPQFLNIDIPIIYQRHATKSMNLGFDTKSFKSRFFNFLKRQLMIKSGFGYDRFVILSKEHRKHWNHLKNIEVINNPITVEYSNEMALLENKVVIAVGRHSYEKGFDMLIRSWKDVLVEFPDWDLNIYGKENHKLKLRALSKELKINERVHFYDHISNIKEAYLNASMLVCSSRIEGFPLILLEAMSLGVTVISFDCHLGPRAIINHNIDGLLVKPNSETMLSNSIKKLIEDQNLRKTMGKNAKENIMRFSPENVMGKWKDLIEELAIVQ